MHEAVLVHADVDERAEVGDVGHDALERHAGLQILQIFDALTEDSRLELRPRIAPGLLELGQDVLHRRHAEPLVGEAGGREASQQLHVANQ